MLTLGRLKGPLKGGVDLLSGQHRLVEGILDIALKRGRLRAGGLEVLGPHQRRRRTVLVTSKASRGNVGGPLRVLAFTIRRAQCLGLALVHAPLLESGLTVPCTCVLKHSKSRGLFPESVGHLRQKCGEPV